MIGGDLASSMWSLRVAPAVRVLGLLAVVSMTIVCVHGWVRTPRWGRAETVVAARSPSSTWR